MSDDPNDDASTDMTDEPTTAEGSAVATDDPAGTDDHHESTAGTGTPRVVFWASMAIGAVVVLIGLNGLRTANQIDRPMISGGLQIGTYAKFFIGGAILVDVIVLPLAAGLGLLLRKVVPGVVWPAVRAALFTSGVLVLFAYPLVTEKGFSPAKPSVRPRNYDTGLLWSLVVVWAIAAAFAAYAYVERRRSVPATSD